MLEEENKNKVHSCNYSMTLILIKNHTIPSFLGNYFSEYEIFMQVYRLAHTPFYRFDSCQRFRAWKSLLYSRPRVCRRRALYSILFRLLKDEEMGYSAPNPKAVIVIRFVQYADSRISRRATAFLSDFRMMMMRHKNRLFFPHFSYGAWLSVYSRCVQVE